MGLIGFWITEKVLIAMKTPSELMADSVIYLHIYFCGMIFNIVYNMGASILRAVGDSRRPLYVLIMTCVLNIFFDIMLVRKNGNSFFNYSNYQFSTATTFDKLSIVSCHNNRLSH